MSSIKTLFTLLSIDEKKKAFYLTFLLFISALLEVLGIASIIPLIALLSNPDLIESNVLINKAYTFFNIGNTQIFLFYFPQSQDQTSSKSTSLQQLERQDCNWPVREQIVHQVPRNRTLQRVFRTRPKLPQKMDRHPSK